MRVSCINEKQERLLEELELFQDWTERYEYVIGLGKRLAPLPEGSRDESHLIKGCQSQVWIVTEQRGERLHYSATSDSTIVAGLIELLLQVYSDRRPADILATPPDFLQEIQLAEHLSPTRSNGLHAMVQQIRQYAVAAMVAAGG